ncbi:hypothetical protein CDAR_104801 [Caerostris darwini]|uniref:Uncharacterized protein n=1 Tax=Caerostris darwini TaxID=1538125 RepID=A0AAV4W4V6_9ARAC|nr:hypothetical protein CDAR_104801 [Caerostris darwini]
MSFSPVPIGECYHDLSDSNLMFSSCFSRLSSCQLSWLQVILPRLWQFGRPPFLFPTPSLLFLSTLWLGMLLWKKGSGGCCDFYEIPDETEDGTGRKGVRGLLDLSDHVAFLFCFDLFCGNCSNESCTRKKIALLNEFFKFPFPKT